MDKALLNPLVCPVCIQPLEYDESRQTLNCARDKLAYPIRDGVPVMLLSEAKGEV